MTSTSLSHLPSGVPLILGPRQGRMSRIIRPEQLRIRPNRPSGLQENHTPAFSASSFSLTMLFQALDIPGGLKFPSIRQDLLRASVEAQMKNLNV